MLIRENLVQECTGGGGAGIWIGNGSWCQLENNEAVKGEGDGIRIEDAADGAAGGGMVWV